MGEHHRGQEMTVLANVCKGFQEQTARTTFNAHLAQTVNLVKTVELLLEHNQNAHALA